MPRFLVTKCVDAYVGYVAIIEARTALAARRIAYEQDDEIEWRKDGVSEFDDIEWDSVSPKQVADDFEIGETMPRSFDEIADDLERLGKDLAETVSLDDLKTHKGLRRIVLAADDLSNRVDRRALEWAKSR